MRHGSIFTGAGLLDYGLMLAGFDPPVWVAEWDEWRREHILARRFPDAVRYDDVRLIGRDCEPVELLAGGFPCKGASTLGKLEGFGHPETVLWREMARAIGELRPRYVLVENVANLLALHDGAVWGEVLGDLAALGYDVVWDCIPAAAVGAPHGRDRVLAVATYTDSARADAHAASGASRTATGKRASTTADADGVARAPAGSCGGRGEPLARPEPIQRVQRLHGALEAPTDPSGERRQQVAGSAYGDEAQDAGRGADDDHEPVGAGQGIVPTAVEWGEYEPAIRRWEAIVGPAPKPLLRGVDARSPRRLERSRLSALGDGVQVQVGQLVGAYILDREASRMNALSEEDRP